MMILAALLGIAYLADPLNTDLFSGAQALGWIAHLGLIVVLIVVRVKVRARDNIPTMVQGDPCFEDCLCLCCCSPFAQCQLARQVYDTKEYVFMSAQGGLLVAMPPV
jgi:hypothetical protein